MVLERRGRLQEYLSLAQADPEICGHARTPRSSHARSLSRNGLWSPLGIETCPAHSQHFEGHWLNGLGSPLGIVRLLTAESVAH